MHNIHICDECGNPAANIHLTKIENNEVSAVHLCEDCAREKGISIVVDPSKLGIPGLSGPQMADLAAPVAAPAPRLCSSCGTTEIELDKRGLLGCPSCYSVFRDRIDAAQLQFADTLTYTGKMYERGSGFEDETFLREELARAVRGENFEMAVVLRDRLARIAPPAESV